MENFGYANQLYLSGVKINSSVQTANAVKLNLSNENTLTLKNYRSQKINAVSSAKKFARMTSTCNGESDTVVAGTAKNNYICNEGDSVSVDGGGNDYIINAGTNDVTVSGGAGNDEIFNTEGASDAILLGSAGADYIRNDDGANVTIDGGKGDDVISLGYSDDNLIVYRAGDGNDIITGFDGSSTLNISGAKYSATLKDAGIVLTVGAGKITLAGATNLAALNISGTPATLLTVTNSTKSPVTADLLTETIDASKRTKSVKITGNALANSIVGGKKADTLFGGAGNDSLTGGGGKDLFVYTAGNDVITDYAAGDKISVSGAISKSTVNGSDAVFTIGKGSLTVTNGKGKSIVFMDDDARTIIGGAQLFDDGSAKKITLAAAVEVADASARTKSINITGNAFANKIFGGEGNDSLWGGKGNDSLYGGDGDDTFIYKPNEGTDTIFDYSSDDMLKILTVNGKAGDSFSNSAFGNGKLTLTISGGGTVVFDGVAKGDTFNINGKSYTLTAKKLE